MTDLAEEHQRSVSFPFTHVEGREVGYVVLYALSTCVWCKKVKRLLNDLGIDYYYVDVDHLVGEEQAEAKDAVRRRNTRCSFPTLVVNNDECIVGYDEQKIREALGL